MDKLDQKEGLNPQEKNLANGDILTEEEKTQVLKEAALKKSARISLENHWADVKREPKAETFTADELRETILDIAKEDGLEFKIDSENEKIWNQLTNYFSNSDRFEENGMSLKKGILLYGPVGCGKTFLMHVLRRNPKGTFTIVDCTDIEATAADGKKGGDEALRQYFTDQPIKYTNKFGHTAIGWCFDDLGTEPDARHFGSQINVMERIIECRYKNKCLTHIITNLTIEEIKERYGIRVLDRLKEMCNAIKFPVATKSRRK